MFGFVFEFSLAHSAGFFFWCLVGRLTLWIETRILFSRFSRCIMWERRCSTSIAPCYPLVLRVFTFQILRSLTFRTNFSHSATSLEIFCLLTGFLRFYSTFFVFSLTHGALFFHNSRFFLPTLGPPQCFEISPPL